MRILIHFLLLPGVGRAPSLAGPSPIPVHVHAHFSSPSTSTVVEERPRGGQKRRQSQTASQERHVRVRLDESASPIVADVHVEVVASQSGAAMDLEVAGEATMEADFLTFGSSSPSQHF